MSKYFDEKDNYKQNLMKIENLLHKTFDLERLLIDEEPLTEFTIFRFIFNRNKNVGCRIYSSYIRMTKPEDTVKYISHLVVDELFKMLERSEDNVSKSR